ncbi:transcription factor bHLH68-like isoform X4 [Vigna unguiculata]|uniref:transcription factor bHLH68-like isoform X4 n=1 Tax=Vigna unguiculata TaxID=3917 RepID=UPI0010167C83|nr:transcription factor bHLH68-like isoform X4 [Vigna unguiculata]
MALSSMFYTNVVVVSRKCYKTLDYPEKKRNLVSSIFSRKRWEAGMSKFLTLLLMEFLITLMKQSKKILKGALCTNMGVKNFSPLTHLGHTWCLFLLPALLLSLPPSVCNSTATLSVCKKARVQSSSSQAPLKVRKEKLSDRITTLHQLVSPFGKTDTASVLLEAIGYIRFLQGQIEALSSPYLDDASKNTTNQQSVDGERTCVFPEDPGLLLKENNGLKRKGGTNQEAEDKAKELKSRGLCLVPVSCTQHVVTQNEWHGRGF